MHHWLRRLREDGDWMLMQMPSLSSEGRLRWFAAVELNSLAAHLYRARRHDPDCCSTPTVAASLCGLDSRASGASARSRACHRAGTARTL